MQNEQEIFIQLALQTWNGRIAQTNELLSSLTDEQLSNQIAPGRNRGIYLLGHLTATHDAMFAFLGFGKAIFPLLKESFIDKSDNAVANIPSAEDLRQHWNNVNIQLAKIFSQMETKEWFERHTSVSEEDFKVQPARNKLSILLSRTNHLSYHLGQLMLLKPRAVAK